jgi:alpha-beta hydrolase superfamily lysophospholipase
MQNAVENVPFKGEWITGPQNSPFYTRLFAPNDTRAVVIFVHGLLEHGE